MKNKTLLLTNVFAVHQVQFQYLGKITYFLMFLILRVSMKRIFLTLAINYGFESQCAQQQSVTGCYICASIVLKVATVGNEIEDYMQNVQIVDKVDSLSPRYLEMRLKKALRFSQFNGHKST